MEPDAECLANPWDLFYISILDRAKRKCSERGGQLKKKINTWKVLDEASVHHIQN